MRCRRRVEFREEQVKILFTDDRVLEPSEQILIEGVFLELVELVRRILFSAVQFNVPFSAVAELPELFRFRQLDPVLDVVDRSSSGLMSDDDAELVKVDFVVLRVAAEYVDNVEERLHVESGVVDEHPHASAEPLRKMQEGLES